MLQRFKIRNHPWLHRLMLAALLVVVVPAAAKSSEVDFRLLYQAAQLANQAYAGRSEIFGKYPDKTAWVATPGKTNVQYVVLDRKDRKIQAIAVRGTVNKVNWHLDMDDRGVKDRKTGILMHSGFRKAAETIYKDIKPHLKPGYSTHLTGHSLGGAVAVILAMYLADDGYKIGGIYTFGQPRVTNVAGARAYMNLPLIRVVNQNDTVAAWPDTLEKSNQKFAHFGNSVNLLDGPYYAYATSGKTIQFSPGTLPRFLTQISVPDHEMKRYLRNLKWKQDGARRVAFKDRNKHIVRQKRGEPYAGKTKKKTNFNK